LRFDRIRDIQPISGIWRGEFDSIKVYLHFRGWLANAYEHKEADIENVVLGDIRQVVRRVVNPFWLIREVFKYRRDCEIVAPDSVRDRVKQELRTLCKLYDLEV
jgi:predicted DNA-binding transcriptional regulator YafY